MEASHRTAARVDDVSRRVRMLQPGRREFEIWIPRSAVLAALGGPRYLFVCLLSNWILCGEPVLVHVGGPKDYVNFRILQTMI